MFDAIQHNEYKVRDAQALEMADRQMERDAQDAAVAADEGYW